MTKKSSISSGASSSKKLKLKSHLTSKSGSPTSKKSLSKSRKGASSKKSLGITHKRPSSRSSQASTYKLQGIPFTGCNEAKSDLLQQIKECNYGVTYGASLYDSLMLIVICPKHKKVALSRVEDRHLFFPFMGIRNGESWEAAVARLEQRLFASANFRLPKVNAKKAISFVKPRLVDHLRLQLPLYFEILTRITYLVELTADACQAKFCTESKSLDWFPYAHLSNFQNQVLLGPEPGLIDQLLAGPPMREVMVMEAIPMNDELELLRKFINMADLQRVYADYLQHTFPSEYMNQSSFKSYIEKSKLKMPPNQDALFRAFSFKGRSYLDFHEFFLGLAIVGILGKTGPDNDSSSQAKLSPKDVHSSAIAKFEANFLFHYYATHQDSLSLHELNHLASEFSICKSDLAKLKKAQANGSVSKSYFLAFTEKLLLSTVLCPKSASHFMLSPKAPLAQLCFNRAYPALDRRKSNQKKKEDAIDGKLMTRLQCKNCQKKRYTLSMYLVKLSLDGKLHVTMKTDREDVKKMTSIRRERSEKNFMGRFVCNKLLDIIRKFADKEKIYPRKDKSKDTVDWSLPKSRHSCLSNIRLVCKEVRKLLAAGPRVVKVNSPCYVIGDIHGNLRDLLAYEQCLWRTGIYFSTASITFLGDYVDRGDYSVECTLYLLCMKLIAPDHVTLLRGNHETRALQTEFTFLNEVKCKFGKEADAVFEMFNQVFDVMPLVAIIDESIYLAHGGIPSCVAKMDQIAALPCPLVDPDDVPMANEILWNDPITDRQYADLLTTFKDMAKEMKNSKMPCGFFANTKRNTAFYFSDSAMTTFLTDNKLSHLIRAHECIPPGYQFHAGGCCITVFSCSHYCNGINEAAVALVHDEKIRVIQVDTPRNE